MQNYVNTRLCRNIPKLTLKNMLELSCHPDLTLDVLLEYKNSPWSFHTLHEHPNFTFSWVEHFPEKFWDWNALSSKVDIETLKRNPNMYWNWRLITDKTDYRVMMENPDMPWDFSMMYIREIREEHIPFLTMFSDRIPEWKWNRFAKCTDWTTFKNNMHLFWVWFASSVEVRTEEFLPEDVQILRNNEVLFNWIKLTISVHVDIIHANPDLPWNLDFLHWNITSWKTPVKSIESCVREWTASNLIKRRWRECISNPEYKMCRDRLRKEFKEFEREYITMDTSVSFYKLRPDAIIPSKTTPGSVGLDLYSVEPYIVLPGQRVVVSTGLKVRLPDGVYGRIAPRSGLVVKHGLDVGAGVIDPDYTGEVRVVIFNHDSSNPFIIRPGYRVAQLILERVLVPTSVDEITYDPSPNSSA
jgi:dUTP pyrophosphatase